MSSVLMPVLEARILDKRPAVTWWNRLEPRPRSPEVQDAIAARVRDPLWFLTRQWQFGEFQGEDAASPAWISVRARTAPVTGWRPRGAGPSAAMRPITRPLEELVETEGFGADLAVQAELGQELGRLLLDEGLTPGQRDGILAEVRQLFPPDAAGVGPADGAADRFLALVADRGVDGVALARAGATAALLARPGVAPFAVEVTRAVAALQALVEGTLGALGGDTGTSWVTDHLEYQVDVAAEDPAGGGLAFTATPDRDATFEWYTLDLAGRSAAGEGEVPAVQLVRESRLPTFVRFRGMPNHRWWDFERGGTDFGAVIPDKRDLAKLLVMDFMLIHGNDYFVVPFDLPVGSVTRVDELVVHDVFGGATLVDRADQGPQPAGARWSCFAISEPGAGGAPAEFFVLPPSAAAVRLSGEPVEDVRIARDEQANLVWAIEQVVEGGAGGAWPGRERHVASVQEEPPEPVPVTVSPLVYRLQSFVPWHWFPMLPVSLNQVTGETVLEQGRMVRPDGVIPEPLGRLLRRPDAGPYRVREEGVPRTGLKVTREVVRARWTSGETYLWIARRKTAGRGEGSSGLRYDEARRGEGG